MLHLVAKNPATLDLKPLSNYKRTFRQLEKKALAREGGCFSMLEDSDEMARGISEMELSRFDIVIFRQGSFTIATIVRDGNFVCVGYAKRNCSVDADNPAKSENVAVHRAISNCFVDQILVMERPADSLVFTQPTDGAEPAEVLRVKQDPTADTEDADPTAFLPAASPFSTPLHPDDFGGSDYESKA